jgi:acyl-[acyl-carrier-protein]-phospholipid O-acyltransferase/long-chain-fatty-acid--[acyl-carrier-protein] ligase
MAVEEAINAECGAADGELLAVVTAVPDAAKGERLVVFHTIDIPDPQALCRRLAARGLPNIFLPSADSFAHIEELPLLGSGKLDLRKLTALAQERFSRA